MSTDLYYDSFDGAAANFSGRVPNVGGAYTGDVTAITVDGSGNVPVSGGATGDVTSAFATCGASWTFEINFTVDTLHNHQWQADLFDSVAGVDFARIRIRAFNGNDPDIAFTLKDSSNSNLFLTGSTSFTATGGVQNAKFVQTISGIDAYLDGVLLGHGATPSDCFADSENMHIVTGAAGVGMTIQDVRFTDDAGVTVDDAAIASSESSDTAALTAAATHAATIAAPESRDTASVAGAATHAAAIAAPESADRAAISTFVFNAPVAATVATVDNSDVAAIAVRGHPLPLVERPIVGPQLLLNDPLPLRTTRQLGDFAENSPLAVIFGDLTEARFPLRRISATRGHAADHPMQITAAFTGDVPTASWQATIEADVTGQTCTFVDFGAPVPADQQMQAAGRGMRHPLTGALITNPGEIMERLAIIAGRSDKFQTLREQCAAADIRIALRVAEHRSIQAWYDIPAKSAGAIWSSPNISRRYPAGVSGYVLELDVQTASNVRAIAVVDNTADVLRVAYDWCDATDKPRKHIELTANPQRYGGLVKEIDLPCLRSAANAVVVCTPILQRYAGERYDVTLDSRDMNIRPGQWLKLVSVDRSGPHAEWSRGGDAPYVMTLAVDVDRDNGTVGVIGESLLSAPTVTVTAHSIALDDTFDGALEVAERNGIATFTVFDENRRGIAGARVSFDGSAPKTTDSRGQVSFAYTPGQHEIAIEAPGRVAQTLTVTL